MPELVGESQAKAESSVENLGLTVGPIDLAPSAGTAGTVIAQAPSAGSLIATGSEVLITVSSGP
jgi:beta-lactam-binding protein with PASTA domain